MVAQPAPACAGWGVFNALPTIGSDTTDMDATDRTNGSCGGREGDYRVFVLRLWHETGGDGTGAPVWRCSLEDPATGQRRGFASPHGLAGYLISVFGEAGEAGHAKEDGHGTVQRLD